jgi:hypothetical protein
MTMSENEPSAADQRRLAAYELAKLDGDELSRAAVLAAVEQSPSGALGGYDAAATCHLNLLVAVAGADRARETLRMAALDASMHEEDRDD